MKFSVVIPIYNVEKYLNECIDSVLGQDYDDFEVILVDDGSPDNCPAICDEYAKKDSRVKVVHKINGGLSDARNEGVKAATGDYLCFLDSDDYWDDMSALTKISNNLEIHKSNMLQFVHRAYNQSQNVFNPAPQRNLVRMNGLETADVLKDAVGAGHLAISACATVISREFLLKHELFFKKGIKTEDLEWAIRVFVKRPKMSFIDDAFYIYRSDRDGSITSTVDYKHLSDYCDILESSIDVVEKADSDLQSALFSYLMYHALIASALCYRTNISKAQKREILSRLKNVCKNRITKYCLDRRVNLASKIYKIAGFSVMARAMGFYLNHRKK